MSIEEYMLESETESSKKRIVRIVKSPEDLVFYTDTDQSDYPIFITASREVYIKKRPSNIISTFFVKEVKAIESDEVTHNLLNKAIEVMKDVTKKNPEKIAKIAITYEVYEGDMEKLIGEVRAYAIKVISVDTPYSDYKFEGKKAWAIGYDWKKRIAAKAPELEKYIYVNGSEGKKGRARVWVTIKLPILTEDFVKVFNNVLGSTRTTVVLDLEEQIKHLEEMIKQKEQELQMLREQLQHLQLKLQVEKMKKLVLDDETNDLS
ncbi:MAG: hypothetical protein QXE70_10280 [Ignisphaera sp.]